MIGQAALLRYDDLSLSKWLYVRHLGFLKVADISQFLDFQDYGRRHL